MTMKIYSVLASVFICLAIWVLPAMSEYTPSEWKKIKTGEILISEKQRDNPDGSQSLLFVAKGYINAPREEVWKALRDYNHFYEFFPNVRETKIVKKEGETYWVDYMTKVLVMEVRYTLRFEGIEKYKRIESKLDKERPHDIRDSYSSWLLEDAPEGSGTVVTFTNFVDTGIPAPVAIARRAAKSSLPNVLVNVRKRVESGGKWKKTQGS